MQASPSHRFVLGRLKNWLRSVNRRRLARRKQRRMPPGLTEAGLPINVGLQRIAMARSASVQSADSKLKLTHSQRLSSEDLHTALERSECRNPLVVSVSHDDYGVNYGGIQNILGDECREFNRRGVSYLHLCPARPLRSLAPQTQLEDFHFAVRLNGVALGWIDGLSLQKTLALRVQRGTPPHWALHHLMGHSPEVIEQLVSVGCAGAPLFWAHDFFAACTSYTLLRNDVTFCHAPPPDSPACRICVYGPERGQHTLRLKHLLLQLKATVVAPSQNALDVWTRSTRLSPEQTRVLPPARLRLEQQPRPRRSQALRIAYLGGQAYYKGWETFRALAETFRQDERFDFFHFGEAPSGLPPAVVRHVPVKVSPTERNAMVRALTQHEIDVVVCWSLWPETFNFTVHEAIAAGAFVVVRSEQGNVWPAAQTYAPQASRAMKDIAELEEYLKSGQIITDVNASPRYQGDVLLSKGSAEFLALQSEETATT